VKAVVSFFIMQCAFALGLSFFLLYAKLRWRLDLHTIFPTLSFLDLAGLASATLAAALVIYAVTKIRSRRLEAYRFLKNAIMVQIFMVQVFLFYRAQLLALLGLAGNICVLLILNYMIQQEANAGKGVGTSGCGVGSRD
jgi:hypothetical protein